MQFTINAAAFLAFVSAALAQTAGFDVVRTPTKDELVPAGKTYKVTWDAAPADYDKETVSIVLLAGESPSKLVPGAEPIAAGIVNSVGSFDWAVPSDLGDAAVYGLQILLESDPTIFQYSFPFQIEAGKEGPKGNSTSSAVPSSTKKPSSSTAAPEPTGARNSTSAGTPPPPPKTTLTSTVGGGSSPTGGAEVSPVPTNGAARSAAGAIAVLGGLAVAAFGL
ncbi:Uncharacterized protein SAPIO_CDS3139 [Scedosporium apiospermum]|uniref:Yeast cell wall synthesis Kre9/Knh1-like N-terminal domain-containing protein n=1 Tax=Pseudallescheria apiosperma TaxID=563466 RepID=A0A084GA44_PSEDA|nr:Uncharacterized protein SAPIO_CDS3139 [Scedosporium apiospermum]KEZ44206.1 Uncharacterized protein SAPIO_CDS3139 [Scedosporium apiospermum]